MHVVKHHLQELNASTAQQIEQALRRIPEIVRVDVNAAKGLVRVSSTREVARDEIDRALASVGDMSAAPLTYRYHVAGTSCQSCEIKIEKSWKDLPGVERVSVDARTGNAKIVAHAPPALADLQERVAAHGYTVSATSSAAIAAPDAKRADRPSWLQIFGLFAIVLVLGQIISRLGWLRPSVAFGSSATFLSVFLVGLLAASSSCIAVTGGLLLGTIAKARAKLPTVLMFVGGRVVGYGILGGVIGAVGKALSPSPLVVGILTLVAALYMLVMGLEMLQIAPRWLRRLMPRFMPKSLGHGVLNREKSNHPVAPALLGAGTFFLPCGFTQALQLYALTTNSAQTSALLLAAFALGTAPSLLALGWASNSLKGKVGVLFFRFSGALMIVLGLWNIQNGMTITGHPISFPRFTATQTAAAADQVDASNTVNISIDYSGYNPNRFTLRSGTPATLNLSGPAAGQGCLGVFQIPKLGIRKLIEAGKTTTIAFTPTSPGRYNFSCSMGMFRGTFDVI